MENICGYFSERFIENFDEMLLKFKSEKSKRNYINLVNDLCRSAGKDFLELEKTDVKAYFGSIREKSAQTKRQRLAVFRGVAGYMDTALKTKLKDNFSNVGIELPSVYTELEDLPDFADIDKVLAVLKEDEDKTTFAVLAIAAETGLNTGDILELKYENFCLDKEGRPLIRIAPKTELAFARNIPVTKKTAELIDSLGRKYPSANAADPIFKNAHGNALSDRVVQKNIHCACLKAGVKPFGINKVRNLALISMVKGGAPIDALSYALDESGVWFFRLNHAVKDLPEAAASYNHLKVEW